jgi:hypothetical protein
VDTSALDKAINCSTETPEEIHLTKSFENLRFLEALFLELEKSLLQDLHLNLRTLRLSNPQEITNLEPQNLQEE